MMRAVRPLCRGRRKQTRAAWVLDTGEGGLPQWPIIWQAIPSPFYSVTLGARPRHELAAIDQSQRRTCYRRLPDRSNGAASGS